MGRYHSGPYTIQNPEKYVGKKAPYARSSWELTTMRMLDSHPNIIQWGSETIKIPYRNPLTGKYTIYVPDFVVLFEDRKGRQRLEVWEIKPRNQSFLKEAKSERNKLALAVNACKWKAAQNWAKKNGAIFRVITESDLFGL